MRRRNEGKSFAASGVWGIVLIMRLEESPDPSIPEAQPKPFAGRDALYARLQQQILDQPQRQAIVFTGQDGMGKTALLQHFTHTFHDPILSVYFPLGELNWTDEEAWIRLLRTATAQLLLEHNYSMSRLPERTAPDEESKPPPLAAWFREEYLPEILAILRSHRRLVWLFDDAENLWENLPAEHLTYLHDLLAEQEQLSIILTLNSRHEDELSKLQPLVNPVFTERLHPLEREEVEKFFKEIAPALSEAQINQIYENSAGFPTLVQRYAEGMTKPGAQLTSVDDAVYSASTEEFRGRWLLLTQDERFVLTACAGLLYDDPTQPTTAERIERWLVETDYPLDTTTIYAALRGLDYQHLVQQRAEGHLEIVGKLFQRWLLEHARLGDGSAEGMGSHLSWQLIVIGILLVALVIAAVALVPPLVNVPEAVPTVTLNP